MTKLRTPLHLQLLVAAAFGLVASFVGFRAWDARERGPVIISSDPTLAEVVVEVRGEVVRPGVYTLPGDGRVGELIELAGGLTAEADLLRLNLARRLMDEELVIIPRVGTVTPVASPDWDTFSPSGDEPVAISGRVDLNTASAPELESLPGIGPVLAERIVAYRVANGPFVRIEQLMEVEGISETTVEELSELVTLGP